MNHQAASLKSSLRSWSLALLGWIYTALFIGGVVAATRMAGGIYVSPFAPEETVLEFFRLHADAVRFQAFAVFASTVPLGAYAWTLLSRLQGMGVRGSGLTIALFGGVGAWLILLLSGMAQWVLSHEGIATSAQATLGWQDFAFMTGGPGYASLLGIFIAGASIPCLSERLLPRWICLWGLALGVVGQLSILSLLAPGAVYFVPLTRFPGFGWLIACGFVLARSTQTPAVSAADRSKQPTAEEPAGSL